jgi:outer membrane lipoprotein-sorting protein
MKHIAVLACGLLAAALPPAAPAQDNEAEKLFRAMEKKALAAKSFEVAFEYSLGNRKTKGSLLLTRDGKVRVNIRGDFGEGGPNSTFEAVSDGKRVVTKQGPSAGGKKVVGKAPKNFHAVFGTTLSRGGVWFSLLVLPHLQAEGKEIALDRLRIQVSDFKSGGAEKVGGRDAKVIRYRFGEGGMDSDDAEVTLWIDAKTLLPLKRAMVTKRDVVHLTETYRDFKLDPKVDAKAFELPK